MPDGDSSSSSSSSSSESGSDSDSSDSSDSSKGKAKGEGKLGPASFPPLPLPLLQAFERWLSGVPSPPELLELGSAPPPAEDE
jgi:hypothetical protein